MDWKYRETRSSILIDTKTQQKWIEFCNKRNLIPSKEVERLIDEEMGRREK